MPVTYVLEPAPGESLRLKRSGPAGYFPMDTFETWQDWTDYRERNAHLFASPDRLIELPLPVGWAGKPEPGGDAADA
jgi:hypothetical protein